MTTLDPLFGIHGQALQLQRRRMEVLSANLANADTPNYQARDIDFAAVLSGARQASAEGSTLVKTQALHLDGLSAGADLSFRVPLQPTVDGNTVDTQIEQAKFADAALHYQASLGFIDGRVKSMLTAITGQ